ncbi:alpha/beta fold hydrolase [Streptomyces mobaraensis NBRC 13819 = DSM 40847]|uniref:TAP domain-containing protein n=1 Tax=Streptomyces mobaraensis (strain ATCC 29032 / DSM 40847 / JCM 4168 / NBRC 13819 / NCIMB 11159 / IPCR 16-22) TaxID=1223523 RepID=M3BY06_STRM1|nr:alpha/beta fold hydrolase [Streptomyces mobaraensis]EME96531.1 TAP domain-containing protein [Streptomyces mobaraensis NBRC 13819 = DSM 40847]QTT77448.1 alpha/beta fold hydrolase [Streptomyces mobaraensis NBRC 13819 = DSM 40847]
MSSETAPEPRRGPAPRARRALRTAAALGAVALALAGGPAGAVPDGSAGAGTPAPAWRDCGTKDGMPAQCAELPVPVDHARPDGPRIRLRLERIPAARPSARREPPILLIPGGPGLGIAYLREIGPLMKLQRWRENRDVVLFDPRGVGGSAAMRCDRPAPDRPSAITSQAALDATAAANRAFAESCLRRTGEPARHLSADDTAQDIEVLRKAIGQRDGLVAYAGSYGTVFAAAYLDRYRRHPPRALVLDGLVDHSVDLPEFAARNAAGVENAFTRFTRWCAENSACALHGRDAGAVFDRLAAAPSLPAPGAGRRITGDDVRKAAARHMSGGRLEDYGWPRLARSLRAAADGDASGFAHPLGGDKDAGTEGLTRAVLCSDFPMPSRYRALSEHTDRLRRTAPRFGATVFWDVAGDCAGHPSPVTDPPRVPRVSPRSGILLANNLHDPATPLTNALAVLRRLPPTTRVLLADADGHGAAYTSPCANEKLLRYLNDPAGQPPYTVCSAES